MAGRRLKSRMLTAVAVPPLSVAITTTWWPVLTEPMPLRWASTLVELITWYVLMKPSALLTVMEVALTAVTEPRWGSTAWEPPLGLGTTDLPVTPPDQP